MIIKILLTIILLALLVVLGYFIFQIIPTDPIRLLIEDENKDNIYQPEIDYGETPVFLENLRFTHNNISYYIESSCSEKRKMSMKEAFDIFENEFSIIDFYSSSKDSADILVGCSDDYIEIQEDLFAAGEGGPSKIINTSNFNVIKSGKISLYKDQQCERPIVELHELSHVFGFDHSPNPKSIIYNTTRCDQEITFDMIKLVQELYAIKPLPDARISQIDAIKRGNRLDFNVTVMNEGLQDIKNITLTISSNGKYIEKVNLGEIEIGFGRTIQATNIILYSRNIEVIDFVVDEDREIKELSEDNNAVQMKVSSEKN